MAFPQAAGSSGADVNASAVTTHNVDFTRVGTVGASDILLLAAPMNGDPDRHGGHGLQHAR